MPPTIAVPAPVSAPGEGRRSVKERGADRGRGEGALSPFGLTITKYSLSPPTSPAAAGGGAQSANAGHGARSPGPRLAVGSGAMSAGGAIGAGAAGVAIGSAHSSPLTPDRAASFHRSASEPFSVSLAAGCSSPGYHRGSLTASPPRTQTPHPVPRSLAKLSVEGGGGAAASMELWHQRKSRPIHVRVCLVARAHCSTAQPSRCMRVRRGCA